jgi:peptidoglycan/LPS O-acetylase OafA/YrhL
MRPAPTIAETLARGRNNLDAIRLAAALLVLASHAYILTGHAPDEPLAKLLSHSIDGGALAVAVFFILSGVLIARSAQVHTTRAFIVARIRRILPAYLAVILLQALVLGPLLTTLPLASYLATPSLWSGLAASLVFTPHQALPGLFESNPLPILVNASLWTLRIEVLCYAATLSLARVGLLRPGRILLPLAVPWVMLLAIVAARAGHAPAWLTDTRSTAITDCVLHFTMGVAAWVYRDTVRPNLALAGAGGLAILILAPTPLAPIAWHAFLPLIVLALGLARPVTAPLMARLGDISYGTYLYAFPIAQTLLVFLPLSPLQCIALGIPLTLGCAALSRYLVERPFLHSRPDRIRRES